MLSLHGMGQDVAVISLRKGGVGVGGLVPGSWAADHADQANKEGRPDGSAEPSVQSM